VKSLLTISDLADLLQLSRSKCYELKEKIGYLKVGGAVRFRPEDVCAYLDSCEVNGEKARRPAPRPRLKHIEV
jgi:excisionase family DNA binding protein